MRYLKFGPSIYSINDILGLFEKHEFEDRETINHHVYGKITIEFKSIQSNYNFNLVRTRYWNYKND